MKCEVSAVDYFSDVMRGLDPRIHRFS